LTFSKTENIVPFCNEIEITMDVTNNFGTDEWVDLAIFYNLSLIVLEPGDFTEDLTPPNGFNSYWEQSVLIPAGKTVTKSMKVMVGIGTGPTPSITGGDQPIFGEAILVDPPTLVIRPRVPLSFLVLY
jgi:hypothetical protein